MTTDCNDSLFSINSNRARENNLKFGNVSFAFGCRYDLEPSGEHDFTRTLRTFVGFYSCESFFSSPATCV